MIDTLPAVGIYCSNCYFILIVLLNDDIFFCVLKLRYRMQYRLSTDFSVLMVLTLNFRILLSRTVLFVAFVCCLRPVELASVSGVNQGIWGGGGGRVSRPP